MDADAIVIGAGFGGLAAALTLAEAGAKVVLLEQLTYPGGCASTFTRGGYRFEAGATLFSGLEDTGLFGRWKREHALDVEFELMDPPVELITAGGRFPIVRGRDRLCERFAELDGAPREGLRRFFDVQRKVADPLWTLLKDPAALDVRDPARLLRLMARSPAFLPALRWAGRPLADVARWAGVYDFAPFRTFLDAACQITVQCSSSEAEAPFALSALDYFHRGTGHIKGGIGVLASALAGAIEGAGGSVHYGRRVRAIRRAGEGYEVTARDEVYRAPVVVANLIPQQALRLVEDAGARAKLERAARDVAGGWGAVMRYMVCAAPEGARAEPHHFELVQDEGAPFVEGNHLFVSISGADEHERAGPGLRTLTVSTHLAADRLHPLDDAAQASLVDEVQARMRAGLERFLPEWMADVRFDMGASPRTFARFVGRPGGLVGGVPRRAGLSAYRGLAGGPLAPGLFMVGDSVFPGQSTLAVAVGGVLAARRAMASVRA